MHVKITSQVETSSEGKHRKFTNEDKGYITCYYLVEPYQNNHKVVKIIKTLTK